MLNLTTNRQAAGGEETGIGMKKVTHLESTSAGVEPGPPGTTSFIVRPDCELKTVFRETNVIHLPYISGEKEKKYHSIQVSLQPVATHQIQLTYLRTEACRGNQSDKENNIAASNERASLSNGTDTHEFSRAECLDFSGQSCHRNW